MEIPLREQRRLRLNVCSISIKGNQVIWMPYKKKQVIRICMPRRLYQSHIRAIYWINALSITQYSISWAYVIMQYELTQLHSTLMLQISALKVYWRNGFLVQGQGQRRQRHNMTKSSYQYTRFVVPVTSHPAYHSPSSLLLSLPAANQFREI